MNRILNLFLLVILSVSIVFAVGQKEKKTQAIPLQQEIAGSEQEIIQPASDVVYPVIHNPSKQPLAGTYEIGTTSPNFPRLRDAILYLNANGISDHVTFLFTDASYTDTGLTIRNFPGMDDYTVTFKPAPGNVARIYFSGGASLAGFRYGLHFQTAKNIIWDGSNSGGTDRSLTIEMDTTITPRSNAIIVRLNSNNLTFKNLNILGYRNIGQGGLDVVRFDNQITGTPGPQSNMVIDNCLIMRGGGGIFIRGQNGTNFSQNYTITNNFLGGATDPNINNHLQFSAIWTENVKNVIIYKNQINGVITAPAGGSPVAFNFRIGTADVEASYNKISNIVNLAGASRPLVIIFGGSGSAVGYKITATLHNNMIYDIHNFGTGTGGRGMDLIFGNPTAPPYGGSGAGSIINIFHNTFHLVMGPTEANGFTAFIWDGNFFGSNTNPAHFDSILAYNNIFSIQRGSDVVRSHLWFTEATSGALKVDMDYNLYYENRGGFFAQCPNPWPSGSAYMVATLDEWTSITGFDENSKFADPKFVSDTDPHISTVMGVVSPADQMGTAAYTYTYDIDGELRADLTPVDVGADAFIPTPWDYDALPVAVTAPFVGGVPFGYPLDITVIVENNSINSFNIPIQVTIKNALGDPVFGPIVEETDVVVSPYTQYAYTFIQKWTPTEEGAYTIEVQTVLATDQNPANDFISRAQPVYNYLIVSDIGTAPYFEDFEGGLKKSSPIGWESGVIQRKNDFMLATPTQFGGAYSGVNAWYTKLLPIGVYDSNWIAAVYSPYFEFDVPKAIISFMHVFSIEDDWDGVIVQYTEDFGATWKTLGEYNDPKGKNWYNENAATFIFGYPPGGFSATNTNYPNWDYAQYMMEDLDGKVIRFRIVFGADGYVNDLGYAFDNFGIAEPSKIAGVKWYDANRDGVKDLGEMPLEGWTINLTGDATDSKVTDVDGKYEFTDLFDGNYVVTEELKPGWVNTYPVGGSYNITLAAGESVTDKDFGNYWANASITGMVWEDLNSDGVKDAGEPGLDGWRVNLDGPMSDSTLTAGGGLYAFNNLVEGTYTVSEVVQTSWKKTYPAASHTVEINSDGQVVADVNFGNFKFAAISGIVYKDINHNGVKEITEPGMVGITVNLVGPIPDTKLTDGDGLFDMLADFGANVLSINLTPDKYVTNPVGGNYNINVTTSGMVFDNRNFGVSTKMDSLKFRTFLPEDIVALDPKGKIPKAAKRKPIGGYWEFVLTNNTGSPQTELHIQFKNDVAFDRGLTADPFTSVSGDTKKKFDFTGATIPDGGSVTVKGYSKKGKPQQIKKFYWGADPKQHYAVNLNPNFEYLELPMPTYANLINEVYTDGGFAADGGLLVGTKRPDAPKNFGWLLIQKTGDVQKSLRDNSGIHTGGPKFFTTFENGKPLVNQQKSLPPSKHNNKLLAELIALKLAIAASATGHTQAGLGELKYYEPGSSFDGMMIKDIYAFISARMTSKTGNATEYFNLVRMINEAFAGPIDTVSFASVTVFDGVKYLADVPFLRHADGEVLSVITPVERKYVDVPDIFELAQNYPNPFNPTTTIQFTLPEDAIVTLKVYNVLGQEVAILADKEIFTEGVNEVEFDAGNLASGIYFYHIVAEGVGENAQKFSQVKKMVLMK